MNRTVIQSVVLASLLASGVAMAAPETFVIDPTHTFVTFEAKHFGTSTNRGRFDKKSGTITLDRAAKTGKVEVTIDTGSISTGTPAFEAHLRSDAFFNSSVFPKATFVGDKLTFDGDKLSSVAGTLTLLGKSQPVTIKMTSYNCYMNPKLQREVCGGDAETTIQRSAFGMTYGLNFGIPDEVKLVIQIEAIKQ